MKKLFLFIVILGLISCKPSPQAAESADACSKFDKALISLNNATAGYVAQMSFPNADKPGALRAFQAQELNKSAVILKTIIDKGSDTQKAATRMMLAQVYATLAQHEVMSGADGWAKLSAQSSDLMSMVATTLNSSTITKSENTDSATEAINRRKLGEKYAEAIVEIRVTVRARANAITQKQADRTQLQNQLEQKLAAIDQFNQQAFDETGDKRFQLYLQGADNRRQADKLSNQIEAIDHAIELENARQSVIEAKLQSLVARKAEAEKATIQLTKYHDESKSIAAKASTQARQNADQLTAALDQLSVNYDKQVIQPFNRAITLMQNSIQLLERAPRIPGDRNNAVKFEMVSKQAGLAYVKQKLAIALRDYLSLLDILTSHADSQFPSNQLTLIAESQIKVKEMSSNATKAMSEQLTLAADGLKQAVEAGGSKETKLALYAQQLTVHQTILQTTGDLSQRTIIAEIEKQIKETAGP